MRRSAKCILGVCAGALGYIGLNGVVAHVTRGGNPTERGEAVEWVSGSKYWLDQQACRWLGLCGAWHIRSAGWTWYVPATEPPPPKIDYDAFWTSGTENPALWTKQERELRTIPDYVYEHAPYVHLYSGESYWPCDIAEHLVHTSPHLNYTMIEEMQYDRNLTNLDELNNYEGARDGRWTYLKSDDNVEEIPKWLGGWKNIPDLPEEDFGEGDISAARPPSMDDLKHVDLKAMKQQVLKDIASTTTEYPPMVPTITVVSPDGTCGSNAGYTCLGSDFGSCCSWAGYCGTSEVYCGNDCDYHAGECNSPPRAKTTPTFHRDLRRRNLERLTKSTVHTGGRSDAPAVLVVIPKEDGIVDAFWFFFYSYNLGNSVFNIRFGNHVGDWEHSVVRFKHGAPESVFLSEHSFGEAYTYRAMEKFAGPGKSCWASKCDEKAKRPIIYSATGTHAMYAIPGNHPYIIPFGLLHDTTDRGPLWDPVLNSHAFTFDLSSSTLRASTRTPKAPTDWFYFAGHWGDKFYPLSDPRQYSIAGQYHYVNGPVGPRFKNLGRKHVCQGRGECAVKDWLGSGKGMIGLVKGEKPDGEDSEEGGLPGGNITTPE